jgi:hypothetical protein
MWLRPILQVHDELVVEIPKDKLNEVVSFIKKCVEEKPFEDNDRIKAMSMSLDVLARCDELWCFGEEISKGMLVELMFASNHMIKIRHFTEDCKFISNKGVIGNGD